MPYVPCYRAVDIFICGCCRRKGRSSVIVDPVHAHRAAVANVFIYSFDPEYTLKLSVGNRFRMEHYAAVIQLSRVESNKLNNATPDLF